MTDETMSDEELSELAECLEDACRQAQREGKRVGPTNSGFDCCPFGALIGCPLGINYPLPFSQWILDLGVDEETARGFMRGFDGANTPGLGESGHGDRRAFELGRLFREQYS